MKPLKPWAMARLIEELEAHLSHLREAEFCVTDKTAETLQERRKFLTLILEDWKTK